MKIGIDAGGTKTYGILFDQEQVIATYETGMGNVLVDYKQAIDNICDCIKQLMLQTDQIIECIGVGAAGVSLLAKQFEQDLHAIFHIPVFVKTDVQMSHIATFRNTDGVLLIAGTGSVALEKRGHTFIQRGGWGHLLGDEGSAYWIAKQILLTYINYLETGNYPQGFDAYIKLLDKRFKHRSEIIDLVYRQTKDEVAALAKYLDNIDENNVYTQQLIERTAEELVKLIVGHHKQQQVVVAFEGGVVTHNVRIKYKIMSLLHHLGVQVKTVEKQSGAYAILYIKEETKWDME